MEEKTLETLAGEIASSGAVCRLKGTYRLDLAAAKTVVCGEERFGCLLALSRPGLVVDGREAVLYAEADAPLSEDVSLIFLTPQAKFASLRHLDIRFTYKQEPLPCAPSTAALTAFLLKTAASRCAQRAA